MPQSLAQIYLHIVFSTKERRPFLQDQSVRDEMHTYLGGICNNVGCPILRVGGVADHVHVLCRFSRTMTVADLVQELNRESSKMGEDEIRFPSMIFIGKMDTARFRSVQDTWNPFGLTSQIKRNIIES